MVLKMKQNIFFDFSSKLSSSTFQAYATGLKKDEDGVNEHWNLIKGNYKGIHFPVVFKQTHGKKLLDILDTGWPSLYLISDRMKTILEDNKLTGWKTYSIELYDKKGNKITGYHGFSVVGNCGPINYEKSEIIEKRLVPTGPVCKYYKGIVVDQWDGDDFFTPLRTYGTFVTKRAVDVLKTHKISNMNLENLANMEVAVDNIL